MNMDFVCKLPIPKLIKEEYPLTVKAAEIKKQQVVDLGVSQFTQ